MNVGSIARREEEVDEQRCADDGHDGFLAFQIQDALSHV